MNAKWKDFVKTAYAVRGAAPKPRVAIRPKPAPVSRAAIKPAPRTKAMTPPPLKTFNPADFQPVYDFYRDVAPAIRMRELGVKVLPEREQKAFDSLKNIPVRYSRALPDGADEVHDYGNGGIGEHILLSENADSSNLVHELRHALARRVGSNSIDKLNDVWRFRHVDIAPDKPGYSRKWGDEEMLTNNKEHQYRVYLELRHNLGKRPTASEYFDYVSNMRNMVLRDQRNEPATNYQSIADKWMRRNNIIAPLEKYRNALMSISKNDGASLPVGGESYVRESLA